MAKKNERERERESGGGRKGKQKEKMARCYSLQEKKREKSYFPGILVV